MTRTREAKNEYTRQWRLAHPDVVIAWRERNRDKRAAQKRERYARLTEEQKAALVEQRRVWSHSITPSELEDLYRLQGGRCAICDMEAPKVGRDGLYIDHDHETQE